jgi:ribosomal protein L29
MKLQERRDLHALTSAQLQTQLLEAERDMLNFRFDAGLNRLSNSASMHKTRKRIAVLKMLIRENELLAETGFSSVEEYKAFKVSERRAYRQRRKAHA